MEDILGRFVAKSPVAVMVRATMTRTLADTTLDDLFERNCQAQYTRELTFSTVTRLMTQVVFGSYPSIHATYVHHEDEIPVSITSVYNKLDGLETGITCALVTETAVSMYDTIAALPGSPQ